MRAGFGEERRRSSGPWLLLLFLMLAAGAAGAGVWYYQTNVKTVATNGFSRSGSGRLGPRAVGQVRARAALRWPVGNHRFDDVEEADL